MPSMFSVLADVLSVHPGFHGEQLHLEECAALRVLEAVQNQNMQLLVAQKQLSVGQNDDTQESANESDLARDDGAFRKQEELFGGDGEDGDLAEDENASDACDDTSPAPVDLAGLQRLLSRRSEMDNAAAPGRRRDMDVEMASYPDNMNIENETRQPPTVANHGADTPVPRAAIRRGDVHSCPSAAAAVLQSREAAEASGGGADGRDPDSGGRPQYLTANCVVYSFYNGDLTAAIDDHFNRALKTTSNERDSPPNHSESVKQQSGMSAAPSKSGLISESIISFYILAKAVWGDGSDCC